MFQYVLRGLILTSFFTSSVGAVSLTSHRIYLDKSKRTESFVIYNKNSYAESCQLSMVDYPIAIDGNMGKEIKGELPANSAKHLVRFSPRRFDVSPGQTQSVRLSLGRKSSFGIAEYHSYLSIKCSRKESTSKEGELISIAPRVVHNVPIVARTGDLSAELSITNLQLSANNRLNFRINRTGNRSVYGTLLLINRKTNEVVNQLNGVSIYSQSNYRDFEFTITEGLDFKNTMLRFEEIKSYGGSITIEKNVNL